MSAFAVIAVGAILATTAAQNPAPQQDANWRGATSVQTAKSGPWSQTLAQAQAAEQEGRVAEAVRTYKVAAASGSGGAAKRLGEIYGRGAPGVDRDLAESLRWNRQAEIQGEVIAQAVRLR
jgi:TPR repeat protein